MPKVSLTKYIKLVKLQGVRDKRHRLAHDRLPTESYQHMKPGQDAIEAALRSYKTIDIDVAKEFLYDLGYSDSEARLLLWNGVGEARFDFDTQYNLTRYPAAWKPKLNK